MIDPAHHVIRNIAVIFKRRHHVLQRIHAIGGGRQAGRANGLELQRQAFDHARHAHAACGGPEQVGVVRGRAFHGFTAGQHQPQRKHMLGEIAMAEVVFAMHVAGHGPAQAHIARARQRVGKPALGNGKCHEFGQRNARLRPHSALRGIEIEEMVQPLGGKHARGLQRRIAIRAAHAARKHSGRALNDIADVFALFRPPGCAFPHGKVTPAMQCLFFCRVHCVPTRPCLCANAKT